MPPEIRDAQVRLRKHVSDRHKFVVQHVEQWHGFQASHFYAVIITGPRCCILREGKVLADAVGVAIEEYNAGRNYQLLQEA